MALAHLPSERVVGALTAALETPENQLVGADNRRALSDNRANKEALVSARINPIGITSDYYAMSARFCDMGEAEAH